MLQVTGLSCEVLVMNPQPTGQELNRGQAVVAGLGSTSPHPRGRQIAHSHQQHYLHCVHLITSLAHLSTFNSISYRDHSERS
jgi:hypothetical protein